MVLTASSPPSTLQGMFGSPPKRGATLPKYLSGSVAAIDSASAAGHKKTTRSNTLPSHVATMNNMNNNFPITSRNTPAHISINSLPISDNEALNFDNR